MFTNPTVAEFKTQFYRDFPYQDPSLPVDLNFIQDQDIQNAANFVNVNFNPGLWVDQVSYSLGYNLLTAHYLVMNIRASSQGINGQFNFLQQSKNAGAIAEAFAIPQRVLDNPDWAILCKTNYGAQYIQMLLPQLAGNIFIAPGRTLP